MTEINIGKFKQQIVLERRTLKHDGMGGYIELWEPCFKLWCSMEQINNLNPQVRSHNFSHKFYVFIIRKQADLYGTLRVVYKDKPYRIETINESKNNPNFLEIIAYEKVKNEFPR